MVRFTPIPAYSGDSVHRFRRNPSSSSGASRPAIPVHGVQSIGAKRRWWFQASSFSEGGLFFLRMEAPFRVRV